MKDALTSIADTLCDVLSLLNEKGGRLDHTWAPFDFMMYKKNALRLCFFIALLWVIEAVNQLMGHRLNVLGIFPGSATPFPGVLFAPLLHGSFQHLAINTLPLLTLGWFVAMDGFGRYVVISLFIAVVGGSAVWLFGRNAFHVGASGLIFGYFAYLVTKGFLERSLSSIFIASTIVAVYGGILFGAFPLTESVSWETHLFSLLAGALASYLWRNRAEKTASVESESF